MDLELRQITHDNFFQICQLEVAPEQVDHVDSNAVSLAEANFMNFPWFRAIYVDDNPVGFILVDANSDLGKFSLWRLMLDKAQQSKGYGRRAIKALEKELQSEFNISKLFTSVVSDFGSPKEFYLNCGFVPTGALVEGREIELCLSVRIQI